MKQNPKLISQTGIYFFYNLGNMFFEKILYVNVEL